MDPERLARLPIVILGGLLTSTVLNLFLMPPLYHRFASRAATPHS